MMSAHEPQEKAELISMLIGVALVLLLVATLLFLIL